MHPHHARRAAAMRLLGQRNGVQERLGVPVIDGVAVAVKFAEALAALGLGTSKRGDYARPLPKVYDGWAAALGRTVSR